MSILLAGCMNQSKVTVLPLGCRNQSEVSALPAECVHVRPRLDLIFFITLHFSKLTFQLPSSISDPEIARLAPLFSPSTLETVAIQHFGVSAAQASSLKASHRENTEAFKRELLIIFRNKFHGRKVI